MKLYLLKQTDNRGLDTNDYCVVCAENEEDAKSLDPYGNVFEERKICEELGEANDKQKRGVIINSYNAG